MFKVLLTIPDSICARQAEELGATASIDASLGDDHVRAEVARLTDDVGADITVDAAGFVSTVENAVRAHLAT